MLFKSRISKSYVIEADENSETDSDSDALEELKDENNF